MATTKGSHATPVKVRKFSEIANVVKSGHCSYDDILELFNVGTSVPDEAENFEVTELLCEVLDLKISVPTDFVDKLKSNVCDWFGICMPPLFATNKWKRALALKLIGAIRNMVGDIEMTQQENWESLRNILLRHADSLLEMVCVRDEHWFQVWTVVIDILGCKLALNSNRPLLNKLFKVLSPFKDDFQLYPSLQGAVREVPFKLLTVTCWQKVVNYWLSPPADVPLNHVTTIIRFFKRQDAEPAVVRAKCIVMWRVVCLLPPGHKGLQASIDQLFAMLLHQSVSKSSSKASKVSSVPGASYLELVPDVLSEMIALALGAHLHPEYDFVFSDELLAPKHELIGASSLFLQKVFQCFEKLLLVDTKQNAIKPNAAALKAAFSCFLGKVNSNPSSELINSVLKLPQNIFVQTLDNAAVMNNCLDIVIQSIVSGPHCFGANIMTSSKYFSGSMDLMTGSPALMLTRILLAKTIQMRADIDIVLSILKALIPIGIMTVHYIKKVMCLLKLLSDDEAITYPVVLKAWQIVVVSINCQYHCGADFTRETPDLEWICTVILFPLTCFNGQNCDEIASLMGSKHQSELHAKLMANDVTAENAFEVCEALSSKLDKLLSGAKAEHIPAITAATRVLVTSTPIAKMPQGKRHLSATFLLLANLMAAVKNLNCLTEDIVLQFIKVFEALLVCLDGHFTSLVELTSLVVKLLRLPSQSKSATDSALVFSQLLIKLEEKIYLSTALPSIATLNAAYQYCQLVSNADETQNSVLTPKRFSARNDATSPASVRRITPKRVGPTSSMAAAEGEVAKVEKKSAKKLYIGSPGPLHSALADSPQAAIGESGKVEETAVKKLAAVQPSSASTDTGLAQPTNESDPQLAPPRKRAVAVRAHGPLTKHQREKMRKRQDNIPALYVDLTQESQAVADSQPELTQDSSSLVIPQRFKGASADSLINVESRPFASVVQEPEVVEVNGDKDLPKETAKAMCAILRKSKNIMPPIHLKKVHASIETDVLDVTTKPSQAPAGSQDRPFQAFSPANRKKQELAATVSVTPSNYKRETETPLSLENDDGIAMFPEEVNSPVRTVSQRKAPKRNTLDFLWENKSKRKSLKRGGANICDDSEPDQSLCKKQNLTDAGTAARKEVTKPLELSSIIDESSNNSTDSAMSASRKGKRNEVTRLKSNLIMNESPLPTKRARRSSMLTSLNVESNGSNATKPKKIGKTSKSQSQSESDCESVASEVSTASDISLTMMNSHRSCVLPGLAKEVCLQQVSSSSVEIQPSLKTGKKLKSKSSVCKTSAVEPVLPIIKEQNQKEPPKIPIVNVVNLTPTAMKCMLRARKKKESIDEGKTKNLTPAKTAKATSKEDSQNLHADDKTQLTSVTAASPQILTLPAKSSIDKTFVEHTTLSMAEQPAPEIEVITELHLPSLVDAEHQNSSIKTLLSMKALPSTNALPSIEAVPSFEFLPPIEASPSQEEVPSEQSGEVMVQEIVSIPLVCLNSDVVNAGNATEACEDLHAAKDNTNRVENNFFRQASDKENKIIEESQDSIIPCSQSEADTFKVLTAKRRHIRPKILSRSFAKSESKTEVLSPVSVIPETQILDTEIETENNANLDPNQTVQPVAELVISNKTCRPEQDSGNDALLAENQTVLSTKEVEIDTSDDAVVQVFLPVITQEFEPQDLPISEDFLAKAGDVRREDDNLTCIPTEKAPSKDSEVAVGEEMMSPSRPGPKVMENLSPSMLRLLNSTHASKASTTEPTCRSRKMLQMILPFAQEPSTKLKLHAEKQEPSFYVDQTFPAQECLVGEDGTPVLQDWKKCVPSPSSVPARSSMKGSLQKNETSNNRKLHFPFEPTTKVLYYYEKKNSKFNENLSLVKIKKQLRKKRKADQKKVGTQPLLTRVAFEDLSMVPTATGLDFVPMVILSDSPSSTKSDSTENTSSINGSLLIDNHAQLISPPVSETATGHSVALSPDSLIYFADNVVSVEELPSTLLVSDDISEKEITRAGAFEVATLESSKVVNLTYDTPLFSTSQEMGSPVKSMVDLIDPTLTDEQPNSARAPASKPATFANEPAKNITLFEDSYHDYATPTPLSLPDPDLLNDTDPLYADLVDCQQPIKFMVPSLTTPQWQEDLNKELAERSILTVGDFCRRTERQIDLLPIKGNKVKTSLRALQKYKPRLLIADACAKDLLKGLECNKYTKEVYDQLYPCTIVTTTGAQTCSEMEDAIHDNLVKKSSGDKLLDILEKSGKFADDGFLEKLVKKIEPSSYIPMNCASGLVDVLSLELANSINLLPSEERMRRIHTLLSHFKFKD